MRGLVVPSSNRIRSFLLYRLLLRASGLASKGFVQDDRRPRRSALRMRSLICLPHRSRRAKKDFHLGLRLHGCGYVHHRLHISRTAKCNDRLRLICHVLDLVFCLRINHGTKCLHRCRRDFLYQASVQEYYLRLKRLQRIQHHQLHSRSVHSKPH